MGSKNFRSSFSGLGIFKVLWKFQDSLAKMLELSAKSPKWALRLKPHKPADFLFE